MRNLNIPATATTVGLKARWSMNFLQKESWWGPSSNRSYANGGLWNPRESTRYAHAHSFVRIQERIHNPQEGNVFYAK